MDVLAWRGKKTCLRLVVVVFALFLVSCSNDENSPTRSDLPKDDTIWLRVSTDGMSPIVTAHKTRLDAESGDQPAGVAASPVSDADPTLYAFRNVEAFDPDVTGWTIRVEVNPGEPGICDQEMPSTISPQLTLCSELESIDAP